MKESEDCRGRGCRDHVQKYLELRYKYRNHEFWCRRYYIDMAGKCEED